VQVDQQGRTVESSGLALRFAQSLPSAVGDDASEEALGLRLRDRRSEVDENVSRGTIQGHRRLVVHDEAHLDSGVAIAGAQGDDPAETVAKEDDGLVATGFSFHQGFEVGNVVLQDRRGPGRANLGIRAGRRR
jgi:hypothetical protein